MIADGENYNVRAGYYDINAAALPESETFDFIPLNSQSLCSLDPDQIRLLSRICKSVLLSGGYNLIVCAMDTEEHPWPCLSIYF